MTKEELLKDKKYNEINSGTLTDKMEFIDLYYNDSTRLDFYRETLLRIAADYDNDTEGGMPIFVFERELDKQINKIFEEKF